MRSADEIRHENVQCAHCTVWPRQHRKQSLRYKGFHMKNAHWKLFVVAGHVEWSTSHKMNGPLADWLKISD